VHGVEHRVEVSGSFSRTIRWYVDDRLVAETTSSDDTVRLEPGDRSGVRAGAAPPGLPEQLGPAALGALCARFTALGRARRITWYEPEGVPSASARALLGTGGIDLDPEPGSAAARREDRIRQHPRRHAALAVAVGVCKVVLPLVLGALAIRFAVSLPRPDWDLPSIPFPSVDLPSIPWPDVDLPDWEVPGWVSWLADKVQFVWPVLLAAGLVRADITRRRTQDELKSRLKAGAARTPPAATPRDEDGSVQRLHETEDGRGAQP